MKIENLNPESLIPYASNPRSNDSAILGVMASIKEFGFQQPIVIDESNTIIAGHTRLKASLKLGLESVPCVRAEDLTPAQIKAYRIIDNKVAEKADWDFDLLIPEIEDLEIDLADFDCEFDFGSGDKAPPDNFQEFDSDIETTHICPKCKYEWSGKSK